MRIVGGRWAGRSLVSPGGRVRPTSEELRVALMDLLAKDLASADVVDLFAGTGAVGNGPLIDMPLPRLHHVDCLVCS